MNDPFYPFMNSLRWEDAKDYPIAAVIWLFLMVLLPIEDKWVELVFAATGGVFLAAVLDYKGRIHKRVITG